MRFIHLLAFLGTFFIAGCNTLPVNEGGTGDISIFRRSEVVDPESHKVIEITEETTTVNLNQPDNPNNPGTISLVTPEGVKIEVDTGDSQNTSKDVANINSLAKVSWAGIGLVLAGLALGIFSKGKKLIEALIMSGVGLGLIILAYLIPAYSWLFAVITVVIIVGYIGFMAWKYVNRDKALEETVKTVDYLKNNVLTPAQKNQEFDVKMAPVPTMQSDTTRKIVDGKRRKQNRKRKL